MNHVPVKAVMMRSVWARRIRVIALLRKIAYLVMLISGFFEPAAYPVICIPVLFIRNFSQFAGLSHFAERRVLFDLQTVA